MGAQRKSVILVLIVVLGLSACTDETGAEKPEQATPPNIVLLMSDDQGWGDVAYNGNAIVQTPHLDAMATEGVRLDRFYAASPVCSPTRASVLTGRHPFRYGIEWAGAGHLPESEITIAEALQAAGYKTGMFGKWHVGELSRTVNQSYFAGDEADPEHYSPPWDNGFDEVFATESMMPTYNPYYHVGGDYGTEDYRFLQTEAVAENQATAGFRWRDYYWVGPEQFVEEWPGGDSSAIVMDRALDFIHEQVNDAQPFLAVIWFHTPHTPVVAGDDDRSLYPDQPMQAQHWYGSITAMDREIGRLRQALRESGVANNTIVWFSSDNGPSYIHNFNSAGPFKGKKGELTEGGVRVPGIVEWPAALVGGSAVAVPMSTSDMYPTLLAAAGAAMPDNQPELDGINVLPLLSGDVASRGEPIAFQSPIRGADYEADPGRLQFALSADQYKLFSGDGGSSWELYDLEIDPGESTNIASNHPQLVDDMRATLESWTAATKRDADRTH